MAEEFVARETLSTPSPPPRLTGDQEADLRSLREWFHAFYITTVIETGLLDPTYQASGAEGITANDLPDPQQTTIARAQATANLGFQLASQIVAMGRVTITGTNDSASVPFDEDQPDLDYFVFLVASDYTGSPSVDGYRVIKQTRSQSGFVFEVTAAPGAGTSITFDYFVTRNANST